MKFGWLFLVAIIAIYSSAVVGHEQVHVEIYKSYGIYSEIEYFSHFPAAVTIAEEPCPVSECELAHNINEAISYVVMPLFLLLAMGIWILIILKELELETKEEMWEYEHI